MNKKAKATIEQLIAVCRSVENNFYFREDTRAEAKKAIEAGRKLINPPVRFAWDMLIGGLHGSKVYRTQIGYTWYEIRLKKQDDGKRRWVAVTWKSEYMADAIVLHKGADTLAIAKQACVDYGVANAKKPAANG